MAATRKARRSREPGLLTTESQEKFLRFRQAHYDEIQPSQPTECHYVDWKIVMDGVRLRRKRNCVWARTFPARYQAARAKRSKSGAISFEVLELEANHAALKR